MAKICFETGLNHLISHKDRDIGKSVDFIRSGKGSRQGCTSSLRSHHEACSLLAWFQDKDLNALRQHAYTAAKLTRILEQRNGAEWVGSCGNFITLVSDHVPLIEWRSQFITPLYHSWRGLPDRNNVNQPAYHAFQAILALQGKWDLLGERAEYILAHPPIKKMTKYQIDHEFYLGLARGDIDAMEQALNTLTGPKAKIRNFSYSSGFTAHLMSMFGFIYAKLAWRAGYEIEVDSPYLPMEWLPIKPLEAYHEEYDFYADFDMYQPLDLCDAALCPTLDKSKKVDITIGSKPMQKIEKSR